MSSSSSTRDNAQSNIIEERVGTNQANDEDDDADGEVPLLSVSYLSVRYLYISPRLLKKEILYFLTTG